MSPSASRRCQRSTRVAVAVALILVAAALVGWAVLDNVAALGSMAAIAAVVLGAAATRITYVELVQSRRDAAMDRAIQAQDYLGLATQRSAEHADQVTSLQRRIARRETALNELEEALVSAQDRAAEATRLVESETGRADAAVADSAAAALRLVAAEERAAEAIVRIAELEQEVDVVNAELVAWKIEQAEQAGPVAQRWHA